MLSQDAPATTTSLMRQINLATGLLLLTLAACTRTAAPKPVFTLAWSVYIGYDPCPYTQKTGILKKWADNVDIQLRRLDYAASIDAFVAKSVDACAMRGARYASCRRNRHDDCLY